MILKFKITTKNLGLVYKDMTSHRSDCTLYIHLNNLSWLYKCIAVDDIFLFLKLPTELVTGAMTTSILHHQESAGLLHLVEESKIESV